MAQRRGGKQQALPTPGRTVLQKRVPLLALALGLAVFTLVDLGLLAVVNAINPPSPLSASAWQIWMVSPAAQLMLCAVALFFALVALFSGII
jgi:hypothetical protein